MSVAPEEVGASDDRSHVALEQRYGHLSGAALLQPFIEKIFPGRVALVSSFGGEAAVLLALAAEIDPGLPVIFLDTGKMFGETLRYRDALAARLGLGDIRIVRPDPEQMQIADADGMLWRRDPDACCRMRKVEPLERALQPFAAWITGRKRYQSGLRARLPSIEHVGGRIKLNPLAAWSREQIEAELAARDLPRHPLVEDGFLSIGCMPCTERVAPGADARSGRWAGTAKTECGIHLPWPGAVPAG